MKRLMTSAITAACALALSCGGDPTGPSWDDPGGPAVAWFDGLGYAVDLFFPQTGQLVTTAYLTDEVPSDILPLGDGRFAVVNSLSSTVGFYDLSSPDPVSSSLPTGSNPYAACVSGDSLFVALLFADSVAVLDTGSMQVTGYIPVGGNPDAVAAVGGILFVGHGNYPDSSYPAGVTAVDLSTGLIVDTIATPENVLGLRYFQSTGRIHAVSTTYADDGEITVIDPATLGVVGTIATGGTPGLPAQSGDTFVAGDGWNSDRLFVYSEESQGSPWSTGLGVTGVAARGDTLYMTDFTADRVVVGLLSSRMLVDTLESGDGPQGVAIIPR